jgi:hypothetical protein
MEKVGKGRYSGPREDSLKVEEEGRRLKRERKDVVSGWNGHGIKCTDSKGGQRWVDDAGTRLITDGTKLKPHNRPAKV